ncbi:GTPase HflX [Bythopirellula goksoeyrii]|uniref:GTPase HflX n=1 Tax=Bythopirellula goksoeyrii TaxID=1400387 RepID=UPI0028F43F29|nr:GTPase HflX [Bythopirellula goksoeyrii]
MLVGVYLASDRASVGHDTSDPLEELAGLVETAGAEVVGRITQNRPTPDPASYIGQGKVESLKQFVDAADADVVVFDNDLSPAQIRNLEETLGVKVLDRTEIILDIFSARAQTHEARLAVELAQLEYSLPRLKRMWTHLSRMKMGVGMRGPGEKQLETDRRLVEKRINDLRKDLKQIEQRKERAVAARSDRMTVSLVGYTNAGKSTLMNKLTDADVLAEDKLFATLDTRTRRWQLPGWGPVLLSDTVGFIRNLPHNLVASFKATLEETRQADLLIHVADASNPAALDQIAAVYEVLQELGIDEKDTLLALNKVDCVTDPLALESLRTRYPQAVLISAATGDGLPRLASAVGDALSKDFLDLEIHLPASDGKTLAFLAKYGEVLSRTYVEDRTVVHCRLPQKYIGPLRGHEDVQIRPYKGGDLSSSISSNGHVDATPQASVDEVA